MNRQNTERLLVAGEAGELIRSMSLPFNFEKLTNTDTRTIVVQFFICASVMSF